MISRDIVFYNKFNKLRRENKMTNYDNDLLIVANIKNDLKNYFQLTMVENEMLKRISHKDYSTTIIQKIKSLFNINEYSKISFYFKISPFFGSGAITVIDNVLHCSIPFSINFFFSLKISLEIDKIEDVYVKINKWNNGVDLCIKPYLSRCFTITTSYITNIYCFLILESILKNRKWTRKNKILIVTVLVNIVLRTELFRSLRLDVFSVPNLS